MILRGAGESAKGLGWMEGSCCSVAHVGQGTSLNLGSLALRIPSSELLLFISTLHFAEVGQARSRGL